MHGDEIIAHLLAVGRLRARFFGFASRELPASMTS